MNIKQINWQLWVGFLLSFIAPASFQAFFVDYPITRDFPWPSLLLFAVAAVFLVLGIRRAFSAGRPLKSKILGVVLTTISMLFFGIFVFAAFFMSKWIPAAPGAPQLGQKAPEFTMTDTSGQQVSLSGLLSTPVDGKVPKGVLLVFYRGDW